MKNLAAVAKLSLTLFELEDIEDCIDDFIHTMLIIHPINFSAYL
jgi:hypothetical protein